MTQENQPPNIPNNGSPVTPPTTPVKPPSSIKKLWDETAPLEESAMSFGKIFESLLREPFRVLKAVHQSPKLAARVIAITFFTFLVSAGIFGVIVGSFSMGDQLWATPLKLVVGISISMLICLPSLYIFSCLSGSRISILTTSVLMAGASALIGILLIGFAPVFWIFAQSTDTIPIVGVLLLIIWIVCLTFATRLIRNTIESFSAGETSHLKFWVLIFTLVTFQMSCTLRPIIGTSDELLTSEKKFFIAHWIENLDPNNNG